MGGGASTAGAATSTRGADNTVLARKQTASVSASLGFECCVELVSVPGRLRSSATPCRSHFELPLAAPLTRAQPSCSDSVPPRRF